MRSEPDDQQRRERQKRDQKKQFDRERAIAQAWERATRTKRLEVACGGCGESRFFPVHQTAHGPRCKDCFVWAERTTS
jgi:hypothetical protein